MSEFYNEPRSHRGAGRMAGSDPIVRADRLGGDCRAAEETYGAAMAWKHVIATVLASKVENRLLAKDNAYAIAAKLLHENARWIYGID